VDLDDRVLLARVIKNAFGRRRLSGVDVGDDSDIADVGKRRCTRHGKSSVYFQRVGSGKPGPRAILERRIVEKSGGICLEEFTWFPHARKFK
jgi:hypothetical protein